MDAGSPARVSVGVLNINISMNAAAIRLPLCFAPAGLQADLARVAPEEWITHFNTSYFEGAWTGVALRAVGKNAATLAADPTAGDYADTALVTRCPHFAAVMAALQCPLKSVRLLKLATGSNIREHRDYDLGWEAGEVRLHVPVVTNPGVEFYLESRRVVMNEGECWYLNLNLPHRVQNRGAADRIHLVIDCQLNDWLRTMILESPPDAETAPAPASPFEQFRQLVLADPGLQQQLMQTSDHSVFASLALELGEQHGCRFTAGDVDAALKAAKRSWVERWI